MTLPVFVINLDRRPDRWKTISARLNQLNIRFTRVTAIDMLNVKSSGPLTNGETACAMSHCAALRTFLETGQHAAMILEDDVEMSPNITTVLGGTDWWPHGACLIKLDNPDEKPRVMGPCCGQTPTGRFLHQVMLSQAGGGAYLVSRLAAEKAIEACNPLVLPIDIVLFDLRHSQAARDMRPLQVVPAMALHDHEGAKQLRRAAFLPE